MAVNKFINVDLDWAELQLKSWRAYIDANPFDKMEDRITPKETKNGGVIPVTSASIEAQQKNCRETIKDYLMLLEVVKRLRLEETEKETSTYGSTRVSPRLRAKSDISNDDE